MSTAFPLPAIASWRYHEILPGVRICRRAWTSAARAVLPREALSLLARLHREFEPERRSLLAARLPRQIAWDAGELPNYASHESEAVHGDWDVAPVPKDLQTRRVEITGPVSSGKMVIAMLSRTADGARADTAMLDFEDAMKPSWSNVIAGLHHVIGAARQTLRVSSAGKDYRLDGADMATAIVRTRGLHLVESNLQIDGQPVSAGIFDLALCFFHTARVYLERGSTPAFYIPKTEHYLEARWWNELFVALQAAMGIARGTLRATFLIETLPAAYLTEEILYEVREHAAGLNVGRWDKIFSDIKVLRNHADRITADRAAITMRTPWMENYAMRVIKICHERNAYAIGGMSAFTPGKTPAAREDQTAKVIADKAHEYSLGHDGCWVSHPYFIGPAMAQFKRARQLDEMLPVVCRYPDILPKGEGPRTVDGLRTNIRVGIAYQQGWNDDIGCVAWDGLMEDLATFEISRAQTWQWLHHQASLDDGQRVTPALVERIFAEERARILRELADEAELGQVAPRDSRRRAFVRASNDARRVFLRPNLTDFFRTASDRVN